MLLAAPVLTPHTAEYKIKISVLGGKLNTTLEATENGYRAESAIQATGMSRMLARGAIRESSVFEYGEEGLRPNRFLSTDSLSKRGQNVDLTFEWNDSKVSGYIDNEDFSAELDGLVHDRVSLQYGLMFDLLQGAARDNYALQDAEELKSLASHQRGPEDGRSPVRHLRGRRYPASCRHIKSRDDALVRGRTRLPAGRDRTASQGQASGSRGTDGLHRACDVDLTAAFQTSKIASCIASIIAAVTPAPSINAAPQRATVSAWAMPAITGAAGNAST